MNCLQGMCQMQVGPLPFAEGMSIFVEETSLDLRTPSGLGRSIHGWQRQKEIQKCFMLRECFFPKVLLHMFSSWGIGTNSLTHLPSNTTRAWGRSLPLHQKSLDLKQRRTIMYFWNWVLGLLLVFGIRINILIFQVLIILWRKVYTF